MSKPLTYEAIQQLIEENNKKLRGEISASLAQYVGSINEKIAQLHILLSDGFSKTKPPRTTADKKAATAKAALAAAKKDAFPATWKIWVKKLAKENPEEYQAKFLSLFSAVEVANGEAADRVRNETNEGTKREKLAIALFPIVAKNKTYLKSISDAYTAARAVADAANQEATPEADE